ncbi:MAG: tripartite tricarboxylate transporter substrate binding protein [Xanthobacteraceae bacterium]|nr:tripartite tricarboxylate transporter substrate binding protein [Xanthobacteraceae bacterium]
MRSRWIGALILAGCALAMPGSKAQAQSGDYPNRPVKIVIAFSPAGAIDVLGRLIADKLSVLWGQQVIVENRPGAGGNIGAAAAAQAAPDGYTLHFGAQTLGTNVTLAPSTAFHPVTSFEPIMLVSTALEVFMAANESPYKSVKDVIDAAKANPGKLNYASVGIGSSAHLATVLFMEVTGTKMQHVPYSQMSQAYADIFSGRTEIWFTTAGGSLPHVRSGKVRALAVNGSSRSKLLPGLPTMTEIGVPMKDESSWYGFFAPKGTPRAIIDKVNRNLQTVIDMPDMREKELSLGYRFIGGPPDELADYLKSEITKWDDLAKKGAFKAN